MKRLRCVVPALAAALLFLASGTVAGAQSVAERYGSYTVDSMGRPLPVPDPYVLDHVIDGKVLGIGSFRVPQDIAVNRDRDHLYVADTRNNRIVELDRQGALVHQIGPELGLKAPQGVFYNHHDGTLWVADTGNKRILHLGPDGSVLAELGQAQSDVLAGVSAGPPTKVIVDKRGYVYYLEGTGVGMIVMDQESRFRGFLGTNRVGFSLRWLWARYLSTQQQREKLLLIQPTAHTDMYLGRDGFVYTAVQGAATQQIQKLTPVGVNVFVERGLGRKLYQIRHLAELRLPTEPLPQFVSATVDDAGTVTAVEMQSGRIYQYDQDRNLLFAFGGRGLGPGKFGLPREVEMDSHGLLYLLDTARSAIYVMRPTPFAGAVHRASALRFEGRYDESASVWRDVLRYSSNYQLARTGMGRVYYHQGKWPDAMREYALARDQVGYSLAFFEYRQDWLRRNMGWVVLAIFGVLAGAWLGPSLTGPRRKNSRRLDSTTKRELPPFLNILVHPRDTLESLRSARSLWPALILVGLAAAARLLSLAVMAFHMRATPVVGSLADWLQPYRPVAVYLLPETRWDEASVIGEMLRILLPWLMWVLTNYGVSALFEGEGTFKAVACSTAYCLVPYILFAVPLALVGHVLTGHERGLYEALWSAGFVWITILLVLQISVVHDYSGRKTVGVGLVSVFALAMLGGLLFLLGLLGMEVVSFAGDAIYELVLMLS